MKPLAGTNYNMNLKRPVLHHNNVNIMGVKLLANILVIGMGGPIALRGVQTMISIWVAG